MAEFYTVAQAAQEIEKRTGTGLSGARIRKCFYDGVSVMQEGVRVRVPVGKKLDPENEKSPIVFSEADIDTFCNRAGRGKPTVLDGSRCPQCEHFNDTTRRTCRNCGIVLRGTE